MKNRANCSHGFFLQLNNSTKSKTILSEKVEIRIAKYLLKPFNSNGTEFDVLRVQN